ncbi:MAG: class I SAM-dependent methyltransferase, partial [Elusimicrobiales bacterium]|nr:class I SAM-dependent methyltransferase [Elusimicrobiales bacterium]
EYIANETGACVTGVDFADKAIKSANDRIKNNSAKIRFINEDINLLDIPGNSFDTIICIDAIGKQKNIRDIIKKLKTIVSKNGQMAFFYSDEILPQEPKNFLEPDKTELATALIKENLKYGYLNFSKEEGLLWKRSKKAEIDLKNEFEKEGYMDLYNDIVDDSDEILHAIREGRHCRYLYHVKI